MLLATVLSQTFQFRFTTLKLINVLIFPNLMFSFKNPNLKKIKIL